MLLSEWCWGEEGILISNILLVFGVEVVLVEGGRKLPFLTFIGPIIKLKLRTLNSSSPLSSIKAPSTVETSDQNSFL